MKITFLGHASLHIEVGGKHLVVDPFITGNPINSVINIETLQADYILITHAHQDHILDVQAIGERTGATIISNFEIVSHFEKIGLKDRINHKPTELSGGEQQRAAVCRALFNQPKIIFGDEPSGNLDTKNSQELHELFFQLREEFNQTFVIVTHNKDLAKMADRTLTMIDGKFIR